MLFSRTYKALAYYAGVFYFNLGAFLRLSGAECRPCAEHSVELFNDFPRPRQPPPLIPDPVQVESLAFPHLNADDLVVINNIPPLLCLHEPRWYVLAYNLLRSNVFLLYMIRHVSTDRLLTEYFGRWIT